MPYKPIGYWAGNVAQLEILEEEIGSYCQKLTEDQRKKLAGCLLAGLENPGTVSGKVWEIFGTDPKGFAKALIDA